MRRVNRFVLGWPLNYGNGFSVFERLPYVIKRLGATNHSQHGVRRSLQFLHPDKYGWDFERKTFISCKKHPDVRNNRSLRAIFQRPTVKIWTNFSCCTLHVLSSDGWRITKQVSYNCVNPDVKNISPLQIDLHVFDTDYSPVTDRALDWAVFVPYAMGLVKLRPLASPCLERSKCNSGGVQFFRDYSGPPVGRDQLHFNRILGNWRLYRAEGHQEKCFASNSF